MGTRDSYTDTTVDQSHTTPWLLFLFSIIFVFAGLWIVFDAASSYDTMMGGLTTFLFGAVSIALGYKLKTK